MTNFIPIFPLGIVVYPGEALNLHIFEERYKQLITECFAENKPFGIPVVMNDRIQDYGTIVKITEVVTVHEDGKMDIRTRGGEIFRILEIIKELPGKLYSGAIVNYPENSDSAKISQMQRLLLSIKELHKMLSISKDFKKPDNELSTYDLAHHAGMNLQEEFELLQLFREDQRQEYLKRHLNKVIPMIAGIESLKEKIKLNGHFRNLKGLDM
jgi:uncharacterized protein